MTTMRNAQMNRKLHARAKARRALNHGLIYLALIFVAALTLFPLLWAFFASMRSDVELYQYALPFSWHTIFPVEYTFDAYRVVLTELGFPKAMLNTLLIIAIQIPAGCLVNSIAGFSFATFRFKGQKLLFGFFLVSFMIPFEAITMPLYQMVNNLGWVDTRWALIVPGIASGMQLFLFRQFFADIPAAVLESARVDRASWPQIFFYIMVPMCVPIFITAGLMIFMSEWNSYMWPLLVARSVKIRTVQIMMATVKMEHITLWSCMYAGAVLSILIPVALFLPLQKYFVEGITAGAVKG